MHALGLAARKDGAGRYVHGHHTGPTLSLHLEPLLLRVRRVQNFPPGLLHCMARHVVQVHDALAALAVIIASGD